MKKLIVLFASVLLIASVVRAGVTADAGYTSKLIEFGSVTNANSVYTVGATGSWESFSVGVKTYDSLHLSPFSAALNRVDVTGGYTFNSTLADATVGATYVHFNNPSKFDFTGHWRPFVSLGKGFYAVSAAYDTQSRLVNVEGKLHTSVELGRGFALVPAAYVGYTNVSDALPKTVKAIKYNNAYYGGNLDLTWKSLGVGGFINRDNNLNKTSTGWRAFASLKF